MNTPNYTLWQLIDALGDQPSLAPPTVGLVLPVQLWETKRNAYFSFHQSGRFSLANQITIEKVELRSNLKNEASGMVILTIGGDCVSIEQVREQFPHVTVAGHPRGRSLDEETTYKTTQAWGTLSFGFKERLPKCLATVAVDRTAPPSPD